MTLEEVQALIYSRKLGSDTVLYRCEEPVLIGQSDSLSLYVTGWNAFDILVEGIDQNREVTFKNRPLSPFFKHAMWIIRLLDGKALKKIEEKRLAMDYDLEDIGKREIEEYTKEYEEAREEEIQKYIRSENYFAEKIIYQFKKSILLLDSHNLNLYAIGWCSFDIVVEARDNEGNLKDPDRDPSYMPLGVFLKMSPYVVPLIDEETVMKLRRNRPQNYDLGL